MIAVIEIDIVLIAAILVRLAADAGARIVSRLSAHPPKGAIALAEQQIRLHTEYPSAKMGALLLDHLKKDASTSYRLCQMGIIVIFSRLVAHQILPALVKDPLKMELVPERNLATVVVPLGDNVCSLLQKVAMQGFTLRAVDVLPIL